MLLRDDLWPFYLRLGSPLTAFCRCRLLSEAPSDRIRRSARGLRPALLSAFKHRSPPGDLRASLLLCAPAPWRLGVLAGAGGLPQRLAFRFLCAQGRFLLWPRSGPCFACTLVPPCRRVLKSDAYVVSWSDACAAPWEAGCRL